MLIEAKNRTLDLRRQQKRGLRLDIRMAAVVAATTGRVLEEVKLEIENFEEEYEGETDEEKWRKVKEKVEMMGGRTSEEEEKWGYLESYVVTTARVELVISEIQGMYNSSGGDGLSERAVRESGSGGGRGTSRRSPLNHHLSKGLMTPMNGGGQ